MYVVVKPLLNNQLVSKREQLRSVKQNEAKKMYEDDIFVVIHPLTEAASCLYGKGTQWCTAAKDCSKFEHYNSQGKLYIIIDKQSGEKYQFHAESNSYMDETDMPIDEPLSAIGATDGLLNFCCREFLDPLMEYSRPLVLGDKRIYIVKKQDKYGVITSDKKKLLDFELDEIESYITCLLVRNGNHKGIYDVETDNIKWGYVGNIDLVKEGDICGAYYFPNFSGEIFDEKTPYFLHYLKNAYLTLKKHHFTANKLIANTYTLHLLNQCCGFRKNEIFSMTFCNGKPFKMCLNDALSGIFEMYPIIDERLSDNVFMLGGYFGNFNSNSVEPEQLDSKLPF
jgi:hypothetical protein